MLITGNLQPADFGSRLRRAQGSARGVAVIQGIRQAGRRLFQRSHTRDYYLASAADELVSILLAPSFCLALSASRVILGAFEKSASESQGTRVGKYKSAVRPYTRKDLSPEAREGLVRNCSTTCDGHCWVISRTVAGSPVKRCSGG